MLLDALRLAHIWNIPSLVEEMQNQLIKHISLDTYETCGLFYGQYFARAKANYFQCAKKRMKSTPKYLQVNATSSN